MNSGLASEADSVAGPRRKITVGYVSDRECPRANTLTVNHTLCRRWCYSSSDLAPHASPETGRPRPRRFNQIELARAPPARFVCEFPRRRPPEISSGSSVSTAGLKVVLITPRGQRVTAENATAAGFELA